MADDKSEETQAPPQYDGVSFYKCPLTGKQTFAMFTAPLTQQALVWDPSKIAILPDVDPEGSRPLTKIISGGQTGADLAGLKAARAVGLETGGNAPQYFMTSAGPMPELGVTYGLRAMDTGWYPARTMANVDEADATLVFRLKASVGTDKTIVYCEAGKWERQLTRPKKPHRPCYIVIAFTDNTVDSIVRFIQEHNVKTLNVAGHRDDKTAGMEGFTDAVQKTLIEVFRVCKKED